MPSYYDLLGVAVDADVDEIHRAYLRQAQHLHPDRFAAAPEPDRRRAEAGMKALNEAWNTLKNAETRRRYDAEHDLCPNGARPDDAWPDGAWADDGPAARPSFFRRLGVRLALVALLVAGLAGSGIAVFARPDRPPRASRRTAAEWSPPAATELRSAAIRVGLSASEADCFVTWITSRYRPSDQVDPAVIGRGLDACR